MATESLSLSTVLSAQPEAVYGAWLGSADDARIGSGFVGWGMSRGVNLELNPFNRIVQSWRTDEFGAEEPDSTVEVTIEPDGAGGTRLTVSHTGIPEGHRDSYRDGWQKHLEPMAQKLGTGSAAPAAAMPAPKAVKARTAAKSAKKKKPAARKAAKKPAARTAGKRAAGKRATKRTAKKARKAPARRTAGRRAAGKRATKKKVTARRGAAKRGGRKTRR